MKIKNRITTAILSIIAMVARAYVGVIIGLLVIFIGAFVIWRLVELIEEVIPETPPGTQGTNNVTVWIRTNIVAGSVSMSMKMRTTTLGIVDIATQQMVFTFQYGISNNMEVGRMDQTWTAIGSSLPSTIDGNINMISDTPSRLVFTVPFGGNTVVCDIRFDTDGNETYNVCYIDPPHIIVIERSIDMVNWFPIFTNTNCSLATVQTFTDSNGPPVQAFYRSVEYTNQPTLISQ